MALQAKLLRAIETRKIQRVGGRQEIDLNLRLICATHQDIEKKLMRVILGQIYFLG